MLSRGNIGDSLKGINRRLHGHLPGGGVVRRLCNALLDAFVGHLPASGLARDPRAVKDTHLCLNTEIPTNWTTWREHSMRKGDLEINCRKLNTVPLLSPTASEDSVEPVIS